MRFTALIKDGKLSLHDKEGFYRLISQIEGEVWLDIKTAPKSRSPKQNNYYWIIIKQVANEIGYTDNELHEIVKKKFDIESTKELEQVEFSDFLDRLIIYFAGLEIVVEDPRGR